MNQPALLVLGGPGTGKTALSGWLLDEVEATEQLADDRVVLHFFIRESSSRPVLLIV